MVEPGVPTVESAETGEDSFISFSIFRYPPGIVVDGVENGVEVLEAFLIVWLPLVAGVRVFRATVFAGRGVDGPCCPKLS